MEAEPSHEPERHWLKAFGETRSYMHLGLQAGLSIAFYAGLGVLVDKWLDTIPWFTLIGSGLGLFAMFYLFHRLTRKMNAASTARLEQARKEKAKISEPSH